MKILFITALMLGGAGAIAATESEKSLFETSAAHLAKIAGEMRAENQASQAAAVKSVLSILENDRPALKAWGVNTESRDLKAEAVGGSKTL